jgi:hypothetical protein
LEVEYRSSVKGGGGADGGVPNAPVAEEEKPRMCSDEHVPMVVIEPEGCS